MPAHNPGHYYSIWNRATPVNTLTFASAVQLGNYFVPSVNMRVYGISWYFTAGDHHQMSCWFAEDGQTQYVQRASFTGWQKDNSTTRWASAFFKQPQNLISGHRYLMVVVTAFPNHYSNMVASRAAGVATTHGDVTFTGDGTPVANAQSNTSCAPFLNTAMTGNILAIDILYAK